MGDEGRTTQDEGRRTQHPLVLQISVGLQSLHFFLKHVCERAPDTKPPSFNTNKCPDITSRAGILLVLEGVSHFERTIYHRRIAKNIHTGIDDFKRVGFSLFSVFDVRVDDGVFTSHILGEVGRNHNAIVMQEFPNIASPVGHPGLVDCF